MSGPKAVLFDFYGTLVQEEMTPLNQLCATIAKMADSEVTSQEVCSYQNQQYHQINRISYGSNFKQERQIQYQSIQSTLAKYRVQLDVDEAVEQLFETWRRPPLFPETASFLENCPLPICLVSNVDTLELEIALAHCGLKFDRIVTSEGVRAYKPRTEPFEKALEILELKPDEVLHVGDSFNNDILGARTLGIPGFWINRKEKLVPAGEAAPDYMGTSLMELLEIVE